MKQCVDAFCYVDNGLLFHFYFFHFLINILKFESLIRTVNVVEWITTEITQLLRFKIGIRSPKEIDTSLQVNHEMIRLSLALCHCYLILRALLDAKLQIKLSCFCLFLNKNQKKPKVIIRQIKINVDQNCMTSTDASTNTFNTKMK